MFSVSKDGNSLNLTSIEEEESLSSSTTCLIFNNDGSHIPELPPKSILSRSERIFPNIEESRTSNSIPVMTDDNVIDPDLPESTEDTIFKMILIEQVLCAGAVLCVTIGLVTAIVFLSRTTTMATSIGLANLTWSWIGLLKAIITISIAILSIWYKVLSRKNLLFIETLDQSGNSLLFYSCVVVPSVAPTIYHLIIEMRNITDLCRFTMIPDVVIPLTEILFIANVVTIVSDVIFYRIKEHSPKTFSIVYKMTVILVLANSISSLLLNISDQGVHQLLHNASRPHDNSCVQYINSGYFKIIEGKGGFFLQMFTTVFYFSSIIILSVSVRHLPTLYRPPPLSIDEAPDSIFCNHEYSSTSLVLAIIFSIATVIVVPLDVIGRDNTDNPEFIMQIVFSSVHLVIYLFVAVFTVRSLILFRRFWKVHYQLETSTINRFIVWVSLLGQLLFCFQDIINSSQFFHATLAKCNHHNGSVYSDLSQCWTVHGLVIAAAVGNIVQCLLQAVVIGFISHLQVTVKIDAVSFEKISYPLVILLASNVGFCVSDWYLISGYSTFHSFDDLFNKIVWNIFSSFSHPFTLLFRGYSIVYLIQFLSTLKCQKM